jgi:hypothetical protein
MTNRSAASPEARANPPPRQADCAVPGSGIAGAALAPRARPRHFGAPRRQACHARPRGGCRSFDLSDAFDRLDEQR